MMRKVLGLLLLLVVVSGTWAQERQDTNCSSSRWNGNLRLLCQEAYREVRGLSWIILLRSM